MERYDWEDDGDFVEISVPTELVKRVVEAIGGVMMQWQIEQKEKGEEFNALIGASAVRVAMDFMDACMERLPNETIQ